MYIGKAKKKNNKRVYDKSNVCYYCEKEFTKLARHLQQVHSKEVEVQKVLSEKVRSKERQKEFERIKLKGNFLHNMKILELGVGELKVLRRPKEGEDADPNDYIPCKYCQGFIHESEAWRHAKTCQFVPEGPGNAVRSRRVLRYEGRLILASNKFPTGCSQQLSDLVICHMGQDAVGE